MKSGWTDKCITDDTSRHCYEIFDTKITWKKASDLCTYDGGTLAIIESFEQQTFIEDLMKKRRFNVSGLWIGSDKLHPEERRAWADGDYFSYVNWAPGEPNSMVNENCAELRTNNGTWNDVVCRKTNGVICDVKGT
ncbi:hypothetical protein ACJMK2_022538 [Sinanodonta woodiana]|uniref:C-type lectin domain-containing protein n=1 Tax=Sinanodonta woodiana TaxID=1069815 RepID=A0ABD3TLB9_SINWO